MENVPSGQVQTVLGPVDPSTLGITLTHEHLIIDLTQVLPHMLTVPGVKNVPDIYSDKLSQENIGLARYHFAPNEDNYLISDVDNAIVEANLYKDFGGGTVVDVTIPDIGRDPVGLARIARTTGLNIVMGSGHYVDVAHPEEMNAKNEEDIESKIVSDLTYGLEALSDEGQYEGIDRIKAGIIGEVGCSWPLTDNERKVLRAAGRAQSITGFPILIHPGRDETAPLEILEVLDEVGTDLSHTIMGHLDRTVFKKETLTEIAKSGAYMEWDLFGREQHYYNGNVDIDMPSDAKRIEDIGWIMGQGYENKVVVAQDICTKDRLFKYGGHGYFYILSQIIPRMRYKGYSEEYINKLFVENPAKALTIK